MKTPRTDKLLKELRSQGAPYWNADDVMAFLKHSRKLERAIMWALGEHGNFAQRPEGAGAYWWRTELRKRIAAQPNGELTDAGPVTPASRETQSRHSVQ